MSETTPATPQGEPESIGDILRRAAGGLPELDPVAEAQRQDAVDRQWAAHNLATLLQSNQEQAAQRQAGRPTDPAEDERVEADLGQALIEADIYGIKIDPENSSEE